MNTILTAWDFEPSVIAGTIMLGAGYVAALWYGRRHGQAVRWSRAAAFLTSLGVLLFALISPLDVVGDTYLLSAHMIQHLLLILVVPPLALLGLPVWLLRAVLAMPVFDRLERLAAQPIVTLLVFSVVVAGWHLPVFYDAASLDVRCMSSSTSVSCWWRRCSGGRWSRRCRSATGSRHLAGCCTSCWPICPARLWRRRLPSRPRRFTRRTSRMATRWVSHGSCKMAGV